MAKRHLLMAALALPLLAPVLPHQAKADPPWARHDHGRGGWDRDRGGWHGDRDWRPPPYAYYPQRSYSYYAPPPVVYNQPGVSLFVPF